MWLGQPDPVASVYAAIADDPDRELLGRMLTAWYVVLKSTPTMIRDAVKQSNYNFDGSEELREVFNDIAGDRGELNRRRLGWWIKKHSGRIVDGLRIVKGAGNRSAEQWRVEPVSQVSPVRSASTTGGVERPLRSANAYAAASRGE
jgi:hypothetical protein